MKILILGTSNSILSNGWVSGLKEALNGATIENWSVGASPGVQFASSLDTDFSKFDVVFIDSLPNDEEYESHAHFSGTLGYSSPEFTDEIMYQVVSSISCYCPVILVGISCQKYLTDMSDAFSRRRHIASLLNCQFIDFREILDTHLQTLKLAPCDLYEEHPAHPKRALSHKIGHLIGMDIAQYDLPIRPTKNLSYNSYFNTITFKENGNCETKAYMNSFTTAHALQAPAGTSLEITDRSSLIGFYINTKETNCAIELNSTPLSKSVFIIPFKKTSSKKYSSLFLTEPGLTA